MKNSKIEIIVGIFVIVGIVCMGYTSVKLGKVEFFNKEYYPVKAIFTSVTGLRPDTPVEISGVQVGKVENIKLKDYQAVVTLLIEKDIKIHKDAIASIRTKGILGERYIEISPGASNIVLKPGDVIFDTEPAFDMRSIIKKFIVKD